MSRADYLSFPPKTLAEEPLRLPLLWNSGGGLALDKPAGLPAFQDTRVGGGPRSVLNVINERAAAGTPQFERLGVRSLLSVNLLDREASGVVLLAKDPSARAALKNAMGSSQFVFRYHFLTVGPSVEDHLSCDLPIAAHREKPLALISHRTGKKAVTAFRRLEDFGPCSLWESESVYDRFHQVRLHAAEVGLPLLGDPLYQAGRGREPVTVPAAVKKYLPGGRFFLHLAELTFPFGERQVDLAAPHPRDLRIFLRRLVK